MSVIEFPSFVRRSESPGCALLVAESNRRSSRTTPQRRLRQSGTPTPTGTAREAPTPVAQRHVVYMRLDEIQRDPENAKTHADLDLQRAIAEHGFGEAPLLDERTERLLAGHGRLDACAALHEAGRPAPSDVEVDTDGMWKIPVQRGFSSKSDEHAQAYQIAANYLTIKGGFDDRQLAEQLGALQADNMLELTGFNDDGLDMLLRSMTDYVGPRPGDYDPPERSPRTAPDEFPSYDDDIDTDYRCPKCSYEWSGRAK